MSAAITSRQRGRAVIGTIFLMALHAALVGPAHKASDGPMLVALGAYCGALSAFIVAIALASAWHNAGAHPRAQFVHVFISAWLTGAWGAAIGGVIAFVAARTADSEMQRVVGSALISAGFAALFGGRFSVTVLDLLAGKAAATQPLDQRSARRQLGLAAALASGAFAAVHPYIRFPRFLPSGYEGFLYGLVAVVVTLVILPFAGARIMRSVVASGRVKKGPASMLAPIVGALVVVIFGLMAIVVAEPTVHSEWAVWRAVVGALLGACCAMAGASIRK